MSYAAIRVRAPATTANLGPGFDCAAVALDLWNELEVTPGEGVEVEGEGADELPREPAHLGVQAFELVERAEGRRFVFRNRIPLERGLGSSAAAIALGLVAATLAAGRWPDAEELVALGLALEGHPDNLAAALSGGACLTWRSNGDIRVARVAFTLPLVPVALIPSGRVQTAKARASLPVEVPHEDAAFTAARAALLGAALAASDPDLLAEAFHDRLHEPYRAANAPLLELVREQLPVGAVGATLSGSGPSVIVWASSDMAASCAAALRDRFPDEQVVPLRVASLGAGPA